MKQIDLRQVGKTLLVSPESEKYVDEIEMDQYLVLNDLSVSINMDSKTHNNTMVGERVKVKIIVVVLTIYQLIPTVASIPRNILTSKNVVVIQTLKKIVYLMELLNDLLEIMLGIIVTMLCQ